MSKYKRVRVVVVAATLLAPAVSCATAESLGIILSDDAGLTVGGHSGGGASAATGAGGFEEDPGPVTPPASGGSPETSPPASGGVQGGGAFPGTGGQSVPMGTGGSRSSFPPPRGTGGTTGAGAAPGAAGMSVSVGGGASTPMTCASTEKMCGGVCAAPSPKVGCGMTGCDPCTVTAPKNGYITCVNGMCEFDCLSGFMKMGMECQGPPPGTNQGNCPNSALGCPDCGAVFGPGCCAGSKCGCSPIPWTVGILGCV